MMKQDPRDTNQYKELMGAHAILERVAISLDSERPSTLEALFRDSAYHQGITYETRLTREIERAMRYVANWIPCKYEGAPQCQCDCPDCED